MDYNRHITIKTLWNQCVVLMKATHTETQLNYAAKQENTSEKQGVVSVT